MTRVILKKGRRKQRNHLILYHFLGLRSVDTHDPL